MKISETDLSIRSKNILRCNDIFTLEDLIEYPVQELLLFRNWGHRSLVETLQLIIKTLKNK